MSENLNDFPAILSDGYRAWFDISSGELFTMNAETGNAETGALNKVD